MELIVEADSLDVTLAGDRQFVSCDDLVKRLRMCIRHSSGGAAHALKFERIADDVSFLERLARNAGHERSVLRIDVDQPLVAQPLDGLAHRSSRYAQLLGDLDLVHRPAGPKLANDDQGANELVDLLSQRRLAVQIDQLQLQQRRADHLVPVIPASTAVGPPPRQQRDAWPQTSKYINDEILSRRIA